MSNHVGVACHTSVLFDYTDPVSPHLAAARDGAVTPDTDIVEAVVKSVKEALRGGDRDGGGGGGGNGGGNGNGDGDRGVGNSGNLVLVEAAGGVLSPAPSGSLQADAFRPMRLPVLLVGDGKLGGIGATLSALESLRTRGYSVLGIALIAQGEGSRVGAVDEVEVEVEAEAGTEGGRGGEISFILRTRFFSASVRCSCCSAVTSLAFSPLHTRFTAAECVGWLY